MSTNLLEKELLKLKEKVRRSKKMGYWEKRQAYELIAKVARFIDLGEYD